MCNVKWLCFAILYILFWQVPHPVVFVPNDGFMEYNKWMKNEWIKTPWITIGIKTSCIQKKPYLECRKSADWHIKGYYKRCYNKLFKVIKEAKKCHYDNQIKNSTKKNKTTWNTVNKEAHRKLRITNIKLLNIDGITTDNQQLIAETFNNYYVTIAENIKTKDRNAYVEHNA